MINDSYIAGLFDGEGNIQFWNRGDHQYLRLRIVITQKEVLERIKDYFKYGRVRPHTRLPKSSHYRKQWVFDVTTYFNSIDFLTRLHPYLLIKKADAEAALTYLRAHPEDSTTQKY